MRSRSEHLSLITTTLLLWMATPLQLSGTPLGISGAMAAKSAQDSEAKVKRLALESTQPLNAKSLQISATVELEVRSTEESLSQKLEILQQQLVIHRTDGDRIGQADTLTKIGEVYIELNEYQKALESQQQALVIYKEFRYRSDQRNTLITIGEIYLRLNQPSQAQDFFQQALGVYRDINDRQGEAETLGRIGNTYFQLAQYRQVEDLFRQKLESLRKNGDQGGEQLILKVLRSYPSWNQEHIDPAFEAPPLNLSWQQILEALKLNLFLKNNDVFTTDGGFIWRNLHSTGWAYHNLGQYTQALKLYQQALSISREEKSKYPFREAFILADIALIYIDIGKYDLALQKLQDILQFIDKNQLQDLQPEVDTLSRIGLVYKIKGQYNLALQFLQKALEIQKSLISQNQSSKQRPEILNNVGSVYFQMGEYAKAIESYQEALEYPSWTPGIKVLAINNIGLVYVQMGYYAQALETYRKALALFRELNDRPGERLTLSNIAALLEKQNRPELAIVFYKEAVNITETIRQNLRELNLEEQKAYTETVASTYRSLADLLLSQGRILEAQQVLELLKVQELRDFTRDTRAGGETPGIATKPTEAELLKIHDTLITLGRKIEECQKTQCEQKSQLLDQREVIAKEFEENVRSLEQEIRSRRANDKAFLDPNTLGGNAEEIVSAQPGTVLIYPLVLENKLWILWAAQGGITKSIEVPQVGLKQLSETVVKFRQLLQNPNSDLAELKATGKQLYNWLIPQSLQKELKENQIQNLVFSLDHVTRYIPMSAVFDGEKYLMENYNISTIISANLTKMSDRLPPGTQNTSVLALGLSDAMAGFNPLPNVPQELDAIVRESPTDPLGIYQGLELLNKAFDRKALRDNLAGYLILHIATHGEFVPGNAYDSYLLLGNGEKLPIPDIQNFRDLSKVHLVVLSACETALGDTGQDGTEIAGLSYYFLSGGAKAVMSSLWQVNDESTRLLMEQFYNNLAKGTTQSPITKAQALRQAQLSLIRSNQTTAGNADSRSIVGLRPRPGGRTATPAASGFSHPYYWAPFILIGNGL